MNVIDKIFYDTQGYNKPSNREYARRACEIIHVLLYGHPEAAAKLDDMIADFPDWIEVKYFLKDNCKLADATAESGEELVPF